jgi:hypothetical protein
MNKSQVKPAPAAGDRTARKPRSRNSYTKNNVKRALTIARETPGVDQVVIETPEGTKYTFSMNKTEKKDQDHKRWDELTKQAVRNPPRARERGK